MGQIEHHDEVQVLIGLDVGKSEYHAVALTRDGTKLYDKPLPNTEAGIIQALNRLPEHGPALVVVHQPATIGTLPVAFAQASGVLIGYLPGLTMRRVADLHPGEAKTDDARDAFIIAETARTMP
ncbi:transposase [Leucobacter sp. Ag1]|nr:transposase [Leucobacter sp. Ag1]